MIAGVTAGTRPAPMVRRAAAAVVTVVFVQVTVGAVNLLLLAPVPLQAVAPAARGSAMDGAGGPVRIGRGCVSAGPGRGAASATGAVSELSPMSRPVAESADNLPTVTWRLTLGEPAGFDGSGVYAFAEVEGHSFTADGHVLLIDAPELEGPEPVEQPDVRWASTSGWTWRAWFRSGPSSPIPIGWPW